MFNLIGDQGNAILNQNEILFLTPHQNFKMLNVDENVHQCKCLSLPWECKLQCTMVSSDSVDTLCSKNSTYKNILS